jgi:hypothetical protein
MAEYVVAKPMNELAVRNAKYAGECTELHLANRNISALADRTVNEHNEFDRFVNLECLWVNNNYLTRLDGLDMNFRIKHIYAHKNKIDSLKDSSIGVMTFLHTLNLADNRLSDLKLTLDTLQRQHHLKELNLNGNPIAEEKDFRLHVLKKLPWLEVLDNHKITDIERKRSLKLRPLEDQMNLSSDILSTQPEIVQDKEKEEDQDNQEVAQQVEGSGDEVVIDDNSSNDEPSKVSFLATAAATAPATSTSTRLNQLIDRMKQKVKEKRICLKLHFLELDRRSEDCLRDDAVVDVLHLYALWPVEDGGVLPWETNRDDNDDGQQQHNDLSCCSTLQHSFLKKYSMPPPVRAKSGRDASAVNGHLFISYVKLCRDLEPAFGGRDMDDRERRAAEEWNNPLPEKTKVTLMLEKEMTIYQAEMAAEEERLKMSMVGLTEPKDQVVNSSFTIQRHSDRNSPTLSPWEVHALWHFFESLDQKHTNSLKQKGFKDAKLSGKLKRNDLIRGLDEMQYMGRTFCIPAQGVESQTIDPLNMTPADRRQMYDKIFIAFETVEEAAAAKEKAKQAAPEPPPVEETKPPAKMSKAEKLAAEKATAELQAAPPTPVVPVVEGYSWRNFLKGVLNGIVDPDTQLSLLPALTWSALTQDMLLEKSSDLFKEADLLQRRVLTGHESADDVRRIGEMVIHATRLEELAGFSPAPEETQEDDEVAAIAAAAKASAASSNATKAKITAKTGLATVTDAVTKFKSKLNHVKDDEVSVACTESPVETKEARRLALLRKKFRLTQEQVEMMGK